MLFNELTTEDLQSIFSGDTESPAAKAFPFYPLVTPGCAGPGPGFVRLSQLMATNESDDVNVPGSAGWCLKLMHLRALYDDSFHVPLDIGGEQIPARCILGHLWGEAANGPARPLEADTGGKPVVMVISKMPGNEEVREGRNFCGPPYSFLKTALNDAGIPPEVTQYWYVTNLVRWPNLDPRAGALPQKWIKDCLPILQQELKLVRPDYVICLGAEASKAILDGSLKSLAGRVVDLPIPLHDVGEPENIHVAKAVAITHPAAILRTTEQYPAFLATLRNLATLLDCGKLQRNQRDMDFRYIYTKRELRDLVDEILAENPGLKKIAVDAEWHGPHPGEPGAYIRTIQFSHKPGFGAAVVLAHAGGDAAFYPSQASAIDELKRLLDRDDIQLIGHFFQSDLPWLAWAGLPLMHRFTVPDTVEEMIGGEYAGGWDTGLSAHAHDETGELKLESLGIRYNGAHRWDADLQEWKKGVLTRLKLTEDELEGYGECPAPILLPYGCYDVAETRELRDKYAAPGGLLDRDRFGNSSWVPFRTSMMAFPAFLEMTMTGFKIDLERVDCLTDLYMGVLASKTEQFAQTIRWPEFNHRSPQQCKELLFGTRFSGKRNKETGEPMSVRPEGAITLELTPIKSTGSKSKPWSRVIQERQEDILSPCTDKETLGILGAVSPVAAELRDIRFIDQTLKSVLRPPVVDKDGQMIMVNGRRVYDGGIASYLCRDGRVRSAFLQTMETGRASSKRPALQNISNKREADYARILKDLYAWPMRSMFVSNTDPKAGELTVILGADYSGAELLAQACMSRCQLMIEHCQRAALPDGHPDQYDIHSNIAKLAFRLSCPPTKKGLKDAGLKHLRIAAKNIIFGVGYGRGAEACSRQCKEEGADITPAEAQVIIDTIFGLYSSIPAYQDACRLRVNTPGWMRNAKQRLRRFVWTDDRMVLGELERESLNFPMQSLVADAVSEAMYHMYHHPRKAELGYKFALQLHDAIYLEVPARSLDVVYHEIMPECMVDKVSFKACDLNGTPYRDSPDYRFTIDKHAYVRWGAAMSSDICDHLGISKEYAHDDGD